MNYQGYRPPSKTKDTEGRHDVVFRGLRCLVFMQLDPDYPGSPPFWNKVYAAVMSLTTGKVLDYTTRTKTCRFCDQGKNSNKNVKVHDCRKNHNASSKAMEPASALEMFNNAPKQKVKYAFHTGDDDSTTEAHIRQKVSYGVEKFRDIIHMKRCLTTRLYNLSHSKKFADSSILSQKVINYLRTKEMQKQSRQPLTALFPTHLATIKTVTVSGVNSSKIQLHINIMTFRMGKTCLETNWDLPLKIYSVITVLMQWLTN